MGIDRYGHLPLYCQLKAILLKGIEDGELEPNDPIPSEAELMREYGLSRTTVRQAINELVTEGYLYRRQGKGTFVSRPKLQYGLRRLTSFSEDMRSRGLEPSSQVLEFGKVTPPPKVAVRLNLMNEGEKVYRIVRLRFANGEPMGIQESYVHVDPDQVIRYEDVNGGGSLYRLLEERFNISLSEAEETVEATLASAHEARLLGVKKGSPLLLHERITYSLDRRPIEFVKTLYRADRYKYLVYLTRSG